MIYWGLSYGHHDASVTIMEDGQSSLCKVVLFKRYYTKDIEQREIDNLTHRYGRPDIIYLHENKWRDAWRKVKSRDWSRIIPRRLKLPVKPIYGNHHLSHAAAAYYTSGFQDALIVVADAIGELESLAVYKARDGRLDNDPIRVLRYPNSVGLFYSYHTALIGLTPNRDEHILMQMSNGSSYVEYKPVWDSVTITSGLKFICDKNFHHYPTEIVTDPKKQAWIAASTQHVIERYFDKMISHLAGNKMTNLVFTGGVAFNSKLCTILKVNKYVRDLYVPPWPGDGGSSIGAILQHTHQHVPVGDFSGKNS